ncbi:MAG: hypothetical protein NVS1B7_6940 [Candidatus Saccharimonadales bacterium]
MEKEMSDTLYETQKLETAGVPDREEMRLYALSLSDHQRTERLAELDNWWNDLEVEQRYQIVMTLDRATHGHDVSTADLPEAIALRERNSLANVEKQRREVNERSVSGHLGSYALYR